MILLLLSYTNYMQVSTWNIIRLRIISRLTVNDYCRIMFIRRGQRLWVANIFQVLGDAILLVMCVYMYIYVRGFKFVGNGYSRKPRTPPPPEQWRFLSTSIPQISCKWLLYITYICCIVRILWNRGAEFLCAFPESQSSVIFSLKKKKNKPRSSN